LTTLVAVKKEVPVEVVAVQPVVVDQPVVEKPSVKKETPIVAVKKEVPVEVVAVQPLVVGPSNGCEFVYPSKSSVHGIVLLAEATWVNNPAPKVHNITSTHAP